MSTSKRLVLDANILLRAVFGVRVRKLLEAYEDTAAFYTPDMCFEEARKYIPVLAEKHRFDFVMGISVLEQIGQIVNVIDRSLYEEYEAAARARIASCDPQDWPAVATAMALNCPIWTEDRDFFGSGIATWTTNRIELYLRDA
jgi:predicted nucleic acid-binding protein